MNGQHMQTDGRTHTRTLERSHIERGEKEKKGCKERAKNKIEVTEDATKKKERRKE